eukprot:2786560-Alexandrium_andersonii.AAC.1
MAKSSSLQAESSSGTFRCAFKEPALANASRVPGEWLRGMATSSRALRASDVGWRDRGTSGDHLERKPLQGREP